MNVGTFFNGLHSVYAKLKAVFRASCANAVERTILFTYPELHEQKSLFLYQ